MTLVPAYGRDYRTAKEAKASFLEGKDWIVSDFFSPWDGKPGNIEDFRGEGSVTLRFCALRKVTTVKIARKA